MLKMTVVRVTLTCLMLASAGITIAQTDTILLSGVIIKADRIIPPEYGRKTWYADSTELALTGQLSIVNLIQSLPSITVRNAGPGTLANISIRGTSSSHTGIFWNGLPINPPNIAMSDASIIPTFLFDEIAIQYGGGSVHNGSGNIGGSLLLNDKISFNSGLQLATGLSIGSFETQSYHSKINIGTPGFQSKTSFIHSSALNNFKYINRAVFGNPVEFQKNAAYSGESVSQNFAFRLPRKQLIQSSFWYGNQYRQVPGTLTTGISKAWQEDEFLRGLVQYRKYFGKTELMLKVASMHDRLRYFQPLPEIDSRISSLSQIAEGEFLYRKGVNLQWAGGARYLMQTATVTAYGKPKSQYRFSLFTRLRYSLRNKLFTTFSLRHESGAPFLLPALGITYKTNRSYEFDIAASGNFREPTLNDLFWIPGGNPNLQAETAYNAEAGMRKRIGKDESTGLEIEIRSYYSQVDNWIEWIPTSSGYWSPQNVKKVRLTGLESGLNGKHLVNGWHLALRTAFNYSQAINLTPRFPSDPSVSKQLIYTPKNKTSFNLTAKKGKLLTGAKLIRYGERFTNPDNSRILPSYYLIDAYLSYSLKIAKTINAVIQLDARNLTNSEYQLFEYRPMPGIHFMASLTFHFKPINKFKNK